MAASNQTRLTHREGNVVFEVELGIALVSQGGEVVAYEPRTPGGLARIMGKKLDALTNLAAIFLPRGAPDEALAIGCRARLKDPDLWPFQRRAITSLLKICEPRRPVAPLGILASGALSSPGAWRRAVLVRDGHRCRLDGCGSAHRLEAHHILFQGEHPELRLTLSNGVTLCRAHHLELHALRRARDRSLARG